MSTEQRLSADELRKIDAYWRACTYLAAGMIYLRANPLLREPLRPEHIKHRLLGTGDPLLLSRFEACLLAAPVDAKGTSAR